MSKTCKISWLVQYSHYIGGISVQKATRLGRKEFWIEPQDFPKGLCDALILQDEGSRWTIGDKQRVEKLKKQMDKAPIFIVNYEVSEADLEFEDAVAELKSLGVQFDEEGKITYGDDTLDAYGNIMWAMGNDDDFICFDYIFLPNDYVALEAVVNSETGSFIDTYAFHLLRWHNGVIEKAEEMTASAFQWCIENEIRFNTKKSLIAGRKFVSDIKKARSIYLKQLSNKQ